MNLKICQHDIDNIDVELNHGIVALAWDPGGVRGRFRVIPRGHRYTRVRRMGWLPA